MWVIMVDYIDFHTLPSSANLTPKGRGHQEVAAHLQKAQPHAQTWDVKPDSGVNRPHKGADNPTRLGCSLDIKDDASGVNRP